VEIKVISKSKQVLEIEFAKEDATLINPLKERLMMQDSVDYAEIIQEHPQISNYGLFIRVKSGDPVDVLSKVVNELREEVKSFRIAFIHGLKQSKKT
jgi:DNA-directed RNA polymerase subunit L